MDHRPGARSRGRPRPRREAPERRTDRHGSAVDPRRASTRPARRPHRGSPSRPTASTSSPRPSARARPRQLFWPWFGANVCVLGLAYGSFLLGFGISFWQAVVAGVVGIVVSFLLCGLDRDRRQARLGADHGAQPGGVRRQRQPAARRCSPGCSPSAGRPCWSSLATLATATVFDQLGWGGGDGDQGRRAARRRRARSSAAGVLGFDVIMRHADGDHRRSPASSPSSTSCWSPTTIDWSAVVGAAQRLDRRRSSARWCFVMTGFGLGWVNAAADYSRYLPAHGLEPRRRRLDDVRRRAGARRPADLRPAAGRLRQRAVAPRSPPTRSARSARCCRPGSSCRSSSSRCSAWSAARCSTSTRPGLALLAAGLRVPRPVAAAHRRHADGRSARSTSSSSPTSFLGPFQGFLITLGVPIAAWCGIMLADIALRKRDYAEADLFDPRGRYGSVQPVPLALLVVGTVLGWGLVTNTFAGWLDWQGYLLEPLGLGGKDGAWAFANLGVLRRLRWSGSSARSPCAARRSAPRRQLVPVTARGLARRRRPAARVRRRGLALGRAPVRRDPPADPPSWSRPSATAWSGPGSSRRPSPAGAWKEYYEQFPFALQPPDAPLYRAGGRPGRAPGRRRDHVRQVGPRAGRGRRRAGR